MSLLSSLFLEHRNTSKTIHLLAIAHNSVIMKQWHKINNCWVCKVVLMHHAFPKFDKCVFKALFKFNFQHKYSSSIPKTMDFCNLSTYIILQLNWRCLTIPSVSATRKGLGLSHCSCVSKTPRGSDFFRSSICVLVNLRLNAYWSIMDCAISFYKMRIKEI